MLAIILILVFLSMLGDSGRKHCPRVSRRKNHGGGTIDIWGPCYKHASSMNRDIFRR